MDGVITDNPDIALAARDVHLAPIPLPASARLLALGVPTLAARRRR